MMGIYKVEMTIHKIENISKAVSDIYLHMPQHKLDSHFNHYKIGGAGAISRSESL